MTDLRKAAEMALKTLENERLKKDEHLLAVVEEALRQALAQPEWVGLTDEDLSVFTTEFYNGAVWAEAKLKEKNT